MDYEVLCCVSNLNTSMAKCVTAEEFDKDYGHILMRFENFRKGWITFSSDPHPETKRVFKVHTNYQDFKFTRDQLFTIKYLEVSDEDYYRTWGEIYVNGKLTETTDPDMSQS